MRNKPSFHMIFLCSQMLCTSISSWCYNRNGGVGFVVLNISPTHSCTLWWCHVTLCIHMHNNWSTKYIHTHLRPTIIHSSDCVCNIVPHYYYTTGMELWYVYYRTKSNVKSEKSAGEFNIQFVGHRKMPVSSVCAYSTTM